MKRTSAKFKITLWYVLVMMVVSFVVFFVMNSVSMKRMEGNMAMRVTRSVESLTKRVMDIRGDFRTIRPHELFLDGVQMAVYDENGTLICGQNPFGIADDLAFQEKVRSFTYNGNEYYVFDKPLHTASGHTLWVKGVMSATDESIAAKAVARYNLILILVMLVLAAIGGYVITTKTLSPVEKIQKTAKAIIEKKDLTQRIRLEKGSDEFYTLANTFDEMLDEIEKVLQREQQFTSDASHELRTPVAVMMSECEYMENYATEIEEFKESAASVKNQAERMSKLISQLLTISRMDKDAVKLHLEETEVSELLQFICEEQVQIHSESIALTSSIQPGIYAEVDRFMLARLFINLIENAYRYNKENGSIHISLDKEGEKIVFSVTDTGIGMEEEHLSHIWDRFYQADAARTGDERSGTGLGLSMVKWIAQKHDGTLSVQSKSGEGSTFTFTFPQKRAKASG